MLRALALISTLALAPGLAHGDGHLAGAPMPSLKSYPSGECRVVTQTEVVHGVRVHRSQRVGCDTPERTGESRPVAVAPEVRVTINSGFALAPRRFGTSPYVLGSPGWSRARDRQTGYLVGAPRP